ncbi:MAG: hypothetical protein M1833_005872 [Piccolia ochrophora]|nr:MAG: hypothetical protein M1833_005872 [Piccolia ochrophora]
MAQVLAEDIAESPEGLTPTDPQSGAIPIESLQKPRGRKRLFKSLQRLSSSPSLARLGRTQSSSYRSGGKGSISCVSLSSSSSTPYGHSHGYSYSSQSSTGYSTAPTSLASSPGPDAEYFDSFPGRFGIRPVASDQIGEGTSTPTSCPVPPSVRPVSRGKPLDTTPEDVEVNTSAISYHLCQEPKPRNKFDFWGEMPGEIRMEIFQYLKPKDIIKCSAVSKSWNKMCYDGQLWTSLDATEFYRDIPADSLTRIITSAGPFVRDLNLRGCVQLQGGPRAEAVSDACRNLENVSLEGCRIERSSIHYLLLRNSRLAHLNLTGLSAVSNSTCKIIAQNCPQLQLLNVSWCSNMDARGVRKIVDGCSNLKDIRASEIQGFENEDIMLRMFEVNSLERLVLSGCANFSDKALQCLIEGRDNERDPITDRAEVPARKLRHLDLSRCQALTDGGLATLADHVPCLEGLQLGGCTELTDAALSDLLPTVPKLSHLDVEELSELTNDTLQLLARSSCKATLEHLSISYCENLGDQGMLPVIRACHSLQNLDMDNTRISDLVLIEAASSVRNRSRLSVPSTPHGPPSVGLRMVVYDCQNVTWTGVREVLSRNAEIKRPNPFSTSPTSPSYPTQIIQMKCFYGWQMTVEEHTKRVLQGDWAAASRLERMWAEYMMTNEEAGAAGAGGRRRRRRAREAAMLHADEEEGGTGTGGIGRRRRARSGGCAMM